MVVNVAIVVEEIHELCYTDTKFYAVTLQGGVMTTSFT
jgi:hypothetical protein